MPFRLNDDWALITRTKLPAIVEPPKKLGDHWATGLSNGYTTFFLSPEHGEGFRWPGHVPAGKVKNGIFGANDWFPTFAAAAGDQKVCLVAQRQRDPAGHRVLRCFILCATH